MTEFSWPWACDQLGDGGSASYTLDIVEATNRLINTVNIKEAGIIYWRDTTTILPLPGFTGDSGGLLAPVHSGGNTIAIATGVAIVEGWLYASDSGTLIDVTGAASATDLIVLRRDRAAQTVRLALKQAGAGGTATVTQSDATWEIGIAQVVLDGSGNFSSLTDVRKIARPPVGAVIVIDEKTADGTDPDLDVSLIKDLFSSIIIKAQVRSQILATETDIFLRFNGDTGSNYNHVSTETDATGTNITASVTATGINCGPINGATATADLFSPVTIEIPHYATTNKKAANFQSYADRDGTINATGIVTTSGGGSWESTNKINQVTLTIVGNNLTAGSVMTVYGIVGGESAV